MVVGMRGMREGGVEMGWWEGGRRRRRWDDENRGREGDEEEEEEEWGAGGGGGGGVGEKLFKPADFARRFCSLRGSNGVFALLPF